MKMQEQEKVFDEKILKKNPPVSSCKVGPRQRHSYCDNLSRLFEIESMSGGICLCLVCSKVSSTRHEEMSQKQSW